MQLVHVQIEDALLRSDQQVLIAGVRMDPRGGTVDVQRTVVENLGETGTHVNFRRWRQPVGHRAGRRMAAAAMAALRRHWRGIVQQIRLGFWKEVRVVG